MAVSIQGEAHVVLRDMYRERTTGRLEDVEGERAPVFFHRGELYVHPRRAEGRRLEDALQEDSSERVQAIVQEIGQQFSGRELAVKDETVRPETLLGPLPTACFVMEASAHGADEKELLARLGGSSARWRSGEGKRALEELSGLDQQQTDLLSRLGDTPSAGELARAHGRRAKGVLDALLRLGAVGLAEPVGDDAGQEVLTPRVLQLLQSRILDDLEAKPIETDPATHRQDVANLFSRLGHFDHYQLLGIDTSADESTLLAAYHRLARKVHPAHAARLGITDKNRLLEVLFERATEAYLVLNDPKRRAAYNTLAGLGVRAEVDGEQREEEKRKLARRNYLHASSCIAQMDYSQATELLKEAARLDPRPEYWARLGQVEAKNPHWLGHSEYSFRKACEADPDHAGYRVGWAEVLEKLGKHAEAREQFERTLELMPNHPKAQLGLERLLQSGDAPKQKRGLSGLLGRGKS